MAYKKNIVEEFFYFIFIWCEEYKMEKCFVLKIEFPRLLLVVEEKKSRWFVLGKS